MCSLCHRVSPGLGHTNPNPSLLRITPQTVQLCPVPLMHDLTNGHAVQSEYPASGVTRIGSQHQTGVNPGDRRRGAGVLDERPGACPDSTCMRRRAHRGRSSHAMTLWWDPWTVGVLRGGKRVGDDVRRLSEKRTDGEAARFRGDTDGYIRTRCAMVDGAPHCPNSNIEQNHIFIMRFSLSAVALFVAAVAAVDITGAPACAVSPFMLLCATAIPWTFSFETKASANTCCDSKPAFRITRAPLPATRTLPSIPASALTLPFTVLFSSVSWLTAA
jgi:hypothetical protein